MFVSASCILSFETTMVGQNGQGPRKTFAFDVVLLFVLVTVLGRQSRSRTISVIVIVFVYMFEKPVSVKNGCKYTQDSTTLLFIIDFTHFIHLNALKFPKIVKNYYGAPPPPIALNLNFTTISSKTISPLRPMFMVAVKYPQINFIVLFSTISLEWPISPLQSNLFISPVKDLNLTILSDGTKWFTSFLSFISFISGSSSVSLIVFQITKWFTSFISLISPISFTKTVLNDLFLYFNLGHKIEIKNRI